MARRRGGLGLAWALRRNSAGNGIAMPWGAGGRGPRPPRGIEGKRGESSPKRKGSSGCGW
ncbi:hypothetical protein E2562_025121 [Oryza meyeriana var. granulata]|uniref:Uncharacterized protein n=1 Tax=Oryza meyeriana var. granulata TaxID=110450 RepID=A0A6G1CIA0_9ORYZ|nr:hypothetical protein E2562_025121 [Oryza meyeriana var. granulata]